MKKFLSNTLDSLSSSANKIGYSKVIQSHLKKFRHLPLAIILGLWWNQALAQQAVDSQEWLSKPISSESIDKTSIKSFLSEEQKEEARNMLVKNVTSNNFSLVAEFTGAAFSFEQMLQKESFQDFMIQRVFEFQVENWLQWLDGQVGPETLGAMKQLKENTSESERIGTKNIEKITLKAWKKESADMAWSKPENNNTQVVTTGENSKETKVIARTVKQFSKESTNKICSFMNITHNEDRVQCLDALSALYQEAAYFPDYITDIFASRPDVFKNDINIPTQPLLSYVHANIQLYTKNQQVHDYLSSDWERKWVVEVDREKFITDIHRWVENYLKYSHPDEKIAISLVEALGGKIGEVIDNSTGTDGIVNMPQQYKTYTWWAPAAKKFFDRLQWDIYEDADGSQITIFWDNSETTETAKLNRTIDSLYWWLSVWDIKDTLWLDQETHSVSPEEYNNANLVFAALTNTENGKKALATEAEGYGSSSQIWITFKKDVRVIDSKKPQDGRLIVGEYENYITQIYQDWHITLDENTSIEEVLSSLSEWSSIAYNFAMDDIWVPNTWVISHGAIVWWDNPDMTLMGTADNPMKIVQWWYTYEIVLWENGTYSIKKHKWNILQHYRVKQVKVKDKFGVSYQYTTSAPVSLDIKQLFSVWASYKDWVASGNMSTEYIKTLWDRLFQAIGVQSRLDTQEWIAALLKLYLPHWTSVSFSSGENISIKSPSLDIWSFKLSGQLGIYRGKWTPSVSLELNPIENWSEDKIRDEYVKKFKEISEDTKRLDAIIKRFQSLWGEVNEQNIRAKLANVIDLIIIQEFESVWYNVNPKVNLVFDKVNRDYVFHSLDSLIYNIASIFSLDVTKIERWFEARWVPHTRFMENKDAKEYLLNSQWLSIDNVKNHLAPMIGINSEKIQLFSQEAETQTEISWQEMVPGDISEISLNFSRDFQYAKVVFHTDKSWNSRSTQTISPKEEITPFIAIENILAPEASAQLESYSYDQKLKGFDEADGDIVDEYIDFYTQKIWSFVERVREIFSWNVSWKDLKLHILWQIFWETNKNMASRHEGLLETIWNNKEMLLKNLFVRANASKKHASEYSIWKERYEKGLELYMSDLEENWIREETYTTDVPMLLNIHAINWTIQEYIIPAGYQLKGYNQIEFDGITIMWNFDCWGNMITLEPLYPNKWIEDTDIAVSLTRTEVISHSQFVEQQTTVSIAQALAAPVFEKQVYGDHIYQATGEEMVEIWDYSLYTNPTTLTLPSGDIVEITHVPRPKNVNNDMTDEQIQHAVVNYLHYHPRITQNIQNAVNNWWFYRNEDIESLKQEAYKIAIKELESLREYFKEEIIERHWYADGYQLYNDIDTLIDLWDGHNKHTFMEWVAEQNTNSKYIDTRAEINYIFDMSDIIEKRRQRNEPELLQEECEQILEQLERAENENCFEDDPYDRNIHTEDEIDQFGTKIPLSTGKRI